MLLFFEILFLLPQFIPSKLIESLLSPVDMLWREFEISKRYLKKKIQNFTTVLWKINFFILVNFNSLDLTTDLQLKNNTIVALQTELDYLSGKLSALGKQNYSLLLGL